MRERGRGGGGRAGDSQHAFGVEVIMRHWSESYRWPDETHRVCLCSSLSHCCLPPSFSLSCHCCFVSSFANPPHPPRCRLICLIVFLPLLHSFCRRRSVFLFSSIVLLFFRIPGQSFCCLVRCAHNAAIHTRNTPPFPNTSEGVREDPSYSLITKEVAKKTETKIDECANELSGGCGKALARRLINTFCQGHIDEWGSNTDCLNIIFERKEIMVSFYRICHSAFFFFFCLQQWKTGSCSSAWCRRSATRTTSGSCSPHSDKSRSAESSEGPTVWAEVRVAPTLFHPHETRCEYFGHSAL